jgi:DNA-binding cell septation regulator SpoVG
MMEITIEHFEGTYPSFNVGIASQKGKQPFLVVRGCKIANGQNGEFVSGPSTKSEKTQKYWNHTFFSPEFAEAVLKKAKEGMPRQSSEPTRRAPARPASKFDDLEDQIPF